VAIIHEVALLRSRITELEEANERLSKRRKAKKTRLQKGGSLSVQEAEDLVAQTIISSQQSDEIHRSSGQDQGAQLRIRRCSTCGETRYNTYTCQIVVETFKEEDLYNSD
jgi:hypothetical protein